MRNIYKRCPKCGKYFWAASEFFNLCRDCYEKRDNERTLRATKEEVEAAKKEALLHDRTIKKGADLVEHAEQPADGAKTSDASVTGDVDDYDPAQHVMRGCGEVDGRPNCNHECWACMRKHCPYRDKDAGRP